MNHLAGIADDLIPLERDALVALHRTEQRDVGADELVVDLQARPAAVRAALTTLKARDLADRGGNGRFRVTDLGAFIAGQLADRSRS